MNTLRLETGKGLKAILIDVLKPIKVNTKEGSNKYRSEFEFIGIIDNPIEALKNYGKGVYESLEILGIDENLNISL